ncbi:MAG: hypothetical protein ACAI35_04360 [Candidatus Methylacidiphilales bacterium]|nr:hypothetical protein [Candidatus Methylacidiphilales bacterium]
MARENLDKSFTVRVSEQISVKLDKLARESRAHTVAAYLRPIVEDLANGVAVPVVLEEPWLSQLKLVSDTSEIPINKLIRRAVINFLADVSKSESIKLAISADADLASLPKTKEVASRITFADLLATAHLNWRPFAKLTDGTLIAEPLLYDPRKHSSIDTNSKPQDYKANVVPAIIMKKDGSMKTYYIQHNKDKNHFDKNENLQRELFSIISNFEQELEDAHSVMMEGFENAQSISEETRGDLMEHALSITPEECKRTAHFGWKPSFKIATDLSGSEALVYGPVPYNPDNNFSGTHEIIAYNGEKYSVWHNHELLNEKEHRDLELIVSALLHAKSEDKSEEKAKTQTPSRKRKLKI